MVYRAPFVTPLKAALMAWSLCAATSYAAPVITSAEDAYQIAIELVEQGALAEADAVLATLATAPDHFDMRRVDRLAAKIAFAQKDLKRAIIILEELLANADDDWRVRYDLAHIAMADKQWRKAERHLRVLMAGDHDAPIKRRIQRDLRSISEKRTMRFSVRAAAAPSTNINGATRDETFKFAGVIPFALDDNARAQSGIGMNWAVGGVYSPHFTPAIKGHLSLNSQVTDHSNAGFDQTRTRLEAGFRHRLRGVQSTLVASYSRSTFASAPYAQSIGGRLSVNARLSQRLSLSNTLSLEQVSYDTRPGKDGPVYGVHTGLRYLVTRWAQADLTLGFVREETAAKTESNAQYSAKSGLSLKAPWGVYLGVRPAIYFRQFDAASFAYGATRRDVTGDIALSVGHKNLSFGGFHPTLVYSYTENHSTVDLFSYDRHSVDIGFARAF